MYASSTVIRDDAQRAGQAGFISTIRSAGTSVFDHGHRSPKSLAWVFQFHVVLLVVMTQWYPNAGAMGGLLPYRY